SAGVARDRRRPPGPAGSRRVAQGDDPTPRRERPRFRPAPLSRPPRSEPGFAQHSRLPGRGERAPVALQRHLALLAVALGHTGAPERPVVGGLERTSCLSGARRADESCGLPGQGAGANDWFEYGFAFGRTITRNP